MKKTLIGVAAGTAFYFLAVKFLIKTGPEDSGFIPASDGFGVDDAFLGGGSFLVGMFVANAVG